MLSSTITALFLSDRQNFINMKFKLILLALTISSVLFVSQSCDTLNSCSSIVCQFDGECNSGTCECDNFTLEFLVGTWKNSNYEITFPSEGNWTDNGVNTGVFEVFPAEDKIVFYSSTETVWIAEEFSCERIDFGSNGEYIRQ